MADARRALGVRGEEAAARWYVERGYRLIARNWRCREGEIDLIVGSDRSVVFCEVKTRSGDRFGGAAAAVTPAKQARLRRLALRWLSEQGERVSAMRFDVAVAGPDGRVRVIEAAF